MLKSFLIFTDLIKYKLSLAVVLSSVTGYLISGNEIGIQLINLSAGVFFLAAGSAALNQYSEHVTDSLMDRTKNRPIPSGMISEIRVLMISCLLFLSGMFFLYQNGFMSLSLGLVNVVLYNFVYTRLKKVSVLSIIPGGLVGAIPPLIGYSSSGGDLSNLDILSFSAFMFLWQIPHFWLIIVKYGEEYKKAGLATISTFMTDVQIRKLVFFWVLISNTLLLFFFFISEVFGKQFLIPFLLLNILFILLFYRNLFGTSEHKEVKGALILINSYGLLIMILLIFISVIHYF
jgi:protoheme IX farnesyltransferase